VSADVLLLGIDGLDPGLVERWRSDLSALSSLVDAGTMTRIESTVPTATGVAWPAVVTGKFPAKTGVLGFTEDGELIDRNSIQSRCLWQLLDDTGLTACTLSVPVSYPPDPVDGIVVSGFMTPEGADDFVHPRSLDLDFPEVVFDTGRAPKATLLDAVDSRQTVAERLLDDRPWDVFTAVFMEPDRAGHSLLKPRGDGTVDGWDDLRDVYVRTDEAVGSLVDRADARDVVVVSDHGYGRHPRRRLNVRRWLHEHDHLELSDSELRGPSPLSKERVESLLDSVGVTNLLPQGIKRYGRHLLPSEADDVRTVSTDDVGYRELWITGSFDVPDDPDGDHTARLVADLRATTDPETGDAMFEEVFQSADRYDGPYLDRLPDVFARFAPNYRGRPTVGRRIVEPIPTNAVETDHRYHGVLIAAGDRVGSVVEETPSLVDVTPTLLHLVGADVPNDVDGDVLHDLFIDGSNPADRAVSWGPPSAEDRQQTGVSDDAVRDRLEDLGYL